MGTRPAPSYADLFMARRIDQQMMNLATVIGNGENPIKYKRFMDDILVLCRGNIDSLHLFSTELNKIHPTLIFNLVIVHHP